jgi:hypothetical protein
MGEQSHRRLLTRPTIHIHGLKDPGIASHRMLLERYCDPKTSTLLEWDGDHRLPIKTKDVTDITRQIVSLARSTGVLDISDSEN